MPRPLVRETFWEETYFLVRRRTPGDPWHLARVGEDEQLWVRLPDLRNFGLTDEEMAEAKYEAHAPEGSYPWRA